MKRLIYFLIMFVSPAVLMPAQVVMALPANQNPFVGVQTTNTTKIPVQIGNYNYDIPANYFDTQPDSTCNSGGALLRALLPALEGRTDANFKDFMKVGQFSPHITIFMKADWDKKRRDNAQERLDGWAEVIEDNDGPFAKAEYPWHKLEYRYHVGKRQRNLTSDQFRHYKDGVLDAQIECSLVGAVLNPGCDHSFIVNDLTVKIHYPLTRLSQWHMVEKEVKKRIRSLGSRTRQKTQTYLQRIIINHRRSSWQSKHSLKRISINYRPTRIAARVRMF